VRGGANVIDLELKVVAGGGGQRQSEIGQRLSILACHLCRLVRRSAGRNQAVIRRLDELSSIEDRAKTDRVTILTDPNP